MRLLSLTLEHFRNYPKLELMFDENDLHLFLGSNGSGKTNILEAIALLSLTKSFLGVEEEDLRTWGAPYFAVAGRVRDDRGEEMELRIISQGSPEKKKACLRNRVSVPLTAMVGSLPIVAFLPQDLSLFTGPPAERRRFLDTLLCQVSSEYVSAHAHYQRALKQRNGLLRGALGTPDRQALRPWDAQLAEHGALIIGMRLELMETFNLTLQEELRALGEEWTDVAMRYEGTVTSGDRPAIERALLDALRETLEHDALLRSTGSGPHRDDWVLEVQRKPFPSFASRGQQRVAVLALLLLQASYLAMRRGETPVILLDDLFSELDALHRDRVLQTFAHHHVILTATEMPVDDRAFTGAVSMVEQGRVYSAHGRPVPA